MWRVTCDWALPIPISNQVLENVLLFRQLREQEPFGIVMLPDIHGEVHGDGDGDGDGDGGDHGDGNDGDGDGDG